MVLFCGVWWKMCIASNCAVVAAAAGDVDVAAARRF